MNHLKFHSFFTDNLPADSQKENTCRQVYGVCYSEVAPRKCLAPKLLAWSDEVAGKLGSCLQDHEQDEWAQIFSGNRLLEGMKPYAMCYGGHQFGHWAGQLGDGRAINLGEVKTPAGKHLTLQLKGAGKTPYSRTADGLAVLRSSVREFLCSEAMHHLGIPTTRALSLVSTGEQVFRDMFYDGNPKMEPGAVVCRVSPSFIRFGSFEIHAVRQDTGPLKKLMDFTIRNHFPHLGNPGPEVYLLWFQEICTKTMELCVHWMRVGFVHGVLNTDNMSLLGETIDYGPYGWLEGFDLRWTPNTTDAHGRRYSYGNQPGICLWNLAQLANALLPVTGNQKQLEETLNNAGAEFSQKWNEMFAAKLGLGSFTGEQDQQLFSDLVDLLQETETDMTIFFRRLADIDREDAMTLLSSAWYTPEQVTQDYRRHLEQWLGQYRKRLYKDAAGPVLRRKAMNKVNPKYVLRNILCTRQLIWQNREIPKESFSFLRSCAARTMNSRSLKNSRKKGQSGQDISPAVPCSPAVHSLFLQILFFIKNRGFKIFVSLKKLRTLLIFGIDN